MPRGSVETRSTGFRARVYAGKDPITGKQVYLRGEARRNRRDAEADAERLVSQVDADQRPDQHATVGVLLDRWMEIVDHELSTAETTAGYIRRTLKPALGEMPLRKLQHRVDILDRLYSHLRRCNQLCDGRGAVLRPDPSQPPAHSCRPMSPGAVRRVHAILSAALNYAVSWGWIERNPADYAHPPKMARRRVLPPRPDQVAGLLNAAAALDEELGVFLWLAVTTGARRGELVALRWPSIESDRGLLRFASNYVVRRGERRLKGTKTGEERLLSLDTLTVEVLQGFRLGREADLAPAGLTLPPEAFVFSPDPVGARPWHPDHFTHTYRSLANELGIQEPLKNLRHFNATQLLAAGVDLRTTAGRLGHSDGGATTLKVYASWTKPADQRAAEQLADDLTALRQRAADGERGANPAEASPRRPMGLSRPIVEILPRATNARTFHEVADGLLEAIRTGTLTPGDLVPTVSEIAQHSGLARSTAQRAIGLLKEREVIVRGGTRWFVAPVRAGRQASSETAR